VRPEVCEFTTPGPVELKSKERLRSNLHGEDLGTQNDPRYRGQRWSGTADRQTRHFSKANGMFDEPLFPLNTALKAKIDPHWLLEAGLPNMHRKRSGQIGRLIFPGSGRRPGVVRIRGTNADSEGRRRGIPPRPPLPETGAPDALTPGFLLVYDPNQFQHGIVEREAPVSGALSQVTIRWSLAQSELTKMLRFRRINIGADENMVQFDAHGR